MTIVNVVLKSSRSATVDGSALTLSHHNAGEQRSEIHPRLTPALVYTGVLCRLMNTLSAPLLRYRTVIYDRLRCMLMTSCEDPYTNALHCERGSWLSSNERRRSCSHKFRRMLVLSLNQRVRPNPAARLLCRRCKA